MFEPLSRLGDKKTNSKYEKRKMNAASNVVLDGRKGAIERRKSTNCHQNSVALVENIRASVS